MPIPSPLLPPDEFTNAPDVVDRDGIRQFVPQRDTFEMLDGILHYDADQGIAVARREVNADEHWVSGHIPGMPLFPGVLMIESAAQLCCYVYSRGQNESRFFAFGGVDSVRFRGTVVPGDTVVLMAKARKIRRTLGLFDTQAFVGDQMVFEGAITGMVLQTQPGTARAQNG